MLHHRSADEWAPGLRFAAPGVTSVGGMLALHPALYRLDLPHTPFQSHAAPRTPDESPCAALAIGTE